MRGKRAVASAAENPAKNAAQESKNEPEECIICFNNIVEEGRLSCTHSFCLGCIQDWAKRENTCPLCKARFKEIEIVDKPGASAAAPSNGKRRRRTTVRVKNRDQGEDMRAQAWAGAAREMDFFRALLTNRTATMRRYFDVARGPNVAPAPVNHALLPRGAPRPRGGAGLRQPARRVTRQTDVVVPIYDAPEEIELGPVVPAGPTPTQAAARLLPQNRGARQGEPVIVDLVNDPPTPRSPVIVDMTESPPPLQRPRLQAPVHFESPHRHSPARRTVDDIAAAMHPLSPFAVAELTAHAEPPRLVIGRMREPHMFGEFDDIFGLPDWEADGLDWFPEPEPEPVLQRQAVAIDLTNHAADDMEPPRRERRAPHRLVQHFD